LDVNLRCLELKLNPFLALKAAKLTVIKNNIIEPEGSLTKWQNR